MEDEGHGQEILHGQKQELVEKNLPHPENSNVGIKKACKESGISDGSYYHWKIKFSK